MLDYNYTGWSINTPVLFTSSKTIQLESENLHIHLVNDDTTL